VEVAQAAVDIDRDESSQSSESDEYDAVLDRDFANSLLSNFGGPFQIEGFIALTKCCQFI
jgi:hypothetical protein